MKDPADNRTSNDETGTPRATNNAASMRARLRSSAESVGELANVLVHDFKGPVSGLTTSLELLSGSMVGPEDVPQLYQAMRNQLAKMNDLLVRARELYKLNSLEPVALDLGDVLRARLDARAHDFASHDVKLAATVGEGAFPLVADDEALGTVIDALVNNALIASSAGATIDVSLARAGDEAVLTVLDHGVGIPAHIRPNVFRVFYTTRKGSAGMGLTVARQLVIAHGGEIALTSEEGKGTTVTVRLPLESAPA